MPKKEFARCFGEVVRQHRKAQNLSQEHLAEKADLSSKMISLVELAKRIPSLSVADCIASGLSIPLWLLVKETEELRRKRSGIKKLK